MRYKKNALFFYNAFFIHTGRQTVFSFRDFKNSDKYKFNIIKKNNMVVPNCIQIRYCPSHISIKENGIIKNTNCIRKIPIPSSKLKKNNPRKKAISPNPA